MLGDGDQADPVGADQPDGYVSAESERMLAGSAIEHTHDGVVAAEHKVDVVQGLLASVRATADKARAARDAAQAQIDDANTALQQASKPVAPGTDLSPTVLGPPVLTIDEIVGWYQAQNITGYVGGVDLQTMVGYYVFEGAAEGVRGDVAFAQAMVETGAFTSPLTAHNNFAGIGACDSCATGFDFPTPQLGVRAQVQLLHAYADKGLVALDLANPPVGADPDHLSVRGCCPTWNKLTGTWATDPNYGPKIMTIYLSMLEYAYAQRRQPAARCGGTVARDHRRQAESGSSRTRSTTRSTSTRAASMRARQASMSAAARATRSASRSTSTSSCSSSSRIDWSSAAAAA